MAVGQYGTNPGPCAGNWPTTVTILDTVRVPATVPPGEYVLGWRWDGEASAQIWQAPPRSPPEPETDPRLTRHSRLTALALAGVLGRHDHSGWRGECRGAHGGGEVSVRLVRRRGESRQQWSPDRCSDREHRMFVVV